MPISRRTVVAGAAAGGLIPHLAWAADDGVGTPVAPKVLRYAFEVAETSLDPAKINDLYSRTLTPHIFEGLYTYDHLARPVKIKPLTADGMPQHSDDFRVWTARVRPGIFFADDPAFKGKRRELVAQDYVYSLEALRRPGQQEPGVVGDGDRGVSRPARAAPARARPEEALRLRPGDRRHPRHRPLHDPLHAEGAAAADSTETLARRRSVRRGCARGGRVLRRRGRGASGRHGPVQARPVAAQLAHRLRAQPRLPRDALRRRAGRRTMPRARRCSPASRGAACRWSTASRSRSSRRSSRAGSRSSTARPTSPTASATSSRRRRCQRQGRAEPGEERDPRLSDHRGGQQLLPVQHGRSGDRRLQRRPRSRCAGRSASASIRGRSSTTPTWASARWRRGRRCRTPPPTIRS